MAEQSMEELREELTQWFRKLYRKLYDEAGWFCSGAAIDDKVDEIVKLPTFAAALAALEKLEAGKLVELADDQIRPKNPYLYQTGLWLGFNCGVISVIEAGFRKVKPQEGRE